jgi:hypothetical protein
MYAARKSRQEIAQSLGRTIIAVYKKLHLLRMAEHAHAERAAPRRITQQRKCLCCGKAFFSEGAHHRICDNCKATEIFRGVATYAVGVVR